MQAIIADSRIGGASGNRWYAFAENLLVPKNLTTSGAKCSCRWLNGVMFQPCRWENLNLYGKLPGLVPEMLPQHLLMLNICTRHLDLAEAIFVKRQHCNRLKSFFDNGGEGGIRTRGTRQYCISNAAQSASVTSPSYEVISMPWFSGFVNTKNQAAESISEFHCQIYFGVCLSERLFKAV